MSEIYTYAQAAAHLIESKVRAKRDESILWAQRLMDHDPKDFVDICIHFIRASGLPKVGSSDPFFVAKLDGGIKFISSVKSDTLAPVWNERWRVKNVPKHAALEIQVHNKDPGKIINHYIGKISTNIGPGAKELELIGPAIKIHTERGTFFIEIESNPSKDKDPRAAAYEFDGPIRYSRHTSPIAGRLTNINEARLYSTWKMYLKGIKRHFGDVTQSWNREYKAAQTIFQGPTSIPVRSTIKTAHNILYSRTTANAFGVIKGKEDLLSILHSGGSSRPNQSVRSLALAHRIKPAIYTYVISCSDNSFRFSETGAAFFVDFASKHALHSKCAESVFYSGEFHPRPEGGWSAFSDEKNDEDVTWELLIDNNSGTYSPDKEMLPTLQQLLEYNFPGFKILALDHEDPELKKSVAECREYAVKKRHIAEIDLQPNVITPDEKSLAKSMWDFIVPGKGKHHFWGEATSSEEEEPGDGSGDLPNQESNK